MLVVRSAIPCANKRTTSNYNGETLMLTLELDVHTHTVSSGHHTTDTVSDLLGQAYKKNLKLLGISEHGPAMLGSCSESYFRNIAIFRNITFTPPVRMGVKVLYGAEVNILDADGTLDLDNNILQRLDYCLAGMHIPCCTPGSRQENTAAYIKAMKNPFIKILAHPDDSRFPVDYDQLAAAAMEYQVLIEINNASLAPDGYRHEAERNNRILLDLCEKYRCQILLSSDSHGRAQVGEFTYALELIKKTGFPEQLVINSSVKRFLDWGNVKKNKEGYDNISPLSPTVK